MSEIKKFDIVQINPDHDPRFAGCLMIVTKITPDGPFGYFDIPGLGGPPPAGITCVHEENGSLRAYYIVPFRMCEKVGTVSWAPPDVVNEPESSVPFIGFSAERLSKLPTVKPGDKIECVDCGEEHELVLPEGSEDTMFYTCQGLSKLGAVGGKLVVGVKPTISG